MNPLFYYQSILFSDIPTELKSKGIFHTTKILIYNLVMNR
jgi:hypothetical protein